MEEMIESTVINLLVDTAYSKIVNHPEEVEKEGFDEIFQTLTIQTGQDGGDSTKSTMLKVQAKEATDDGYFYDINGSENDDEKAVTAALEVYGIDMIFDITDKGKKYFLPLVKKQIKERLRIVNERLDEAIPTHDEIDDSCVGECSCNK